MLGRVGSGGQQPLIQICKQSSFERRHYAVELYYIIDEQFIWIWPGEAQRGQQAVDLESSAGCPNLQQF